MVGWAASGLFPFNPQRVFRHMPQPLAERTVTEARTVVGSCPQVETLQMPTTPATPVTPFTTEALSSLHDMIKQEACTLDGLNKQRLQRHIQKLASAAQGSFAKEALLQEQTRFLSNINNEVKARRSTRSVVLGRAKVISYEDLEKARAKRTTKEISLTTALKRKRRRKRQSPEPEPEPAAGAARANDLREPSKAPSTP